MHRLVRKSHLPTCASTFLQVDSKGVLLAEASSPAAAAEDGAPQDEAAPASSPAAAEAAPAQAPAPARAAPAAAAELAAEGEAALDGQPPAAVAEACEELEAETATDAAEGEAQVGATLADWWIQCSRC